jgi:hypothetical protein
MSELSRKNMLFKFFYRYDDGTETDVLLEFRGNVEAEVWTKTEFIGLTYLRHERLS